LARTEDIHPAWDSSTSQLAWVHSSTTFTPTPGATETKDSAPSAASGTLPEMRLWPLGSGGDSAHHAHTAATQAGASSAAVSTPYPTQSGPQWPLAHSSAAVPAHNHSNNLSDAAGSHAVEQYDWLQYSAEGSLNECVEEVTVEDLIMTRYNPADALKDDKYPLLSGNSLYRKSFGAKNLSPSGHSATRPVVTSPLQPASLLLTSGPVGQGRVSAAGQATDRIDEVQSAPGTDLTPAAVTARASLPCPTEMTAHASLSSPASITAHASLPPPAAATLHTPISPAAAPAGQALHKQTCTRQVPNTFMQSNTEHALASLLAARATIGSDTSPYLESEATGVSLLSMRRPASVQGTVQHKPRSPALTNYWLPLSMPRNRLAAGTARVARVSGCGQGIRGCSGEGGRSSDGISISDGAGRASAVRATREHPGSIVSVDSGRILASGGAGANRGSAASSILLRSAVGSKRYSASGGSPQWGAAAQIISLLISSGSGGPHPTS
jgi:hypothetical protein